MEENNELYHHGVKGQKWGIIRKEYHQAQKERAAKKEASTAGTAVGVVLGGAAGLGLSFLLNKSKVFKKTDGIFKEVGTGEKYAHSMASVGKRAIGLAFVGGMLGRRLGKYNAMKKSQQEREREAAFDNFINARERFPMNSNQVSHSGIKGMKWGVRRYQNLDGTLTEEGKKRYGNPEGYEAAAKESSALEEATKAASNAVNTATIFTNTQKGSMVIKKDYSGLSDQELQRRVNRLNLERAYGDLSGETKYVKTGREKTREILQTTGAVLAIAATAVGIYNQLHFKGAIAKNN